MGGNLQPGSRFFRSVLNPVDLGVKSNHATHLSTPKHGAKHFVSEFREKRRSVTRCWREYWERNVIAATWCESRWDWDSDGGGSTGDGSSRVVSSSWSMWPSRRVQHVHIDRVIQLHSATHRLFMAALWNRAGRQAIIFCPVVSLSLSLSLFLA